ncbi:MAG TPA: hypothetical protein VL334_10845 [Anaerolineae bacterium]|nr:hypothetical protein [Anaerolineae bacterium]
MITGQMSIPDAVIVAIVSGIFAFLGALSAQLATRKRTSAETAKLLAESEKISVETERLRLDIERQRQDLKIETEKILTTSQETRDEIVAEVEKFSKMAEAQLRARAEEHSLVVGAMIDDHRLQTARIELANKAALQFLAELKKQFPDWSAEDFKVAVDVLKTLGSAK